MLYFVVNHLPMHIRSFLPPALILVLAFAACSHHNDVTPPPVTPVGPNNADSTTATTAGTDSAYWKVIRTGSPQWTDIWFTDTLHGFATSLDGYVYASQDGGVNWSRSVRLDSVGGTVPALALTFLNANVGYAVGVGHFAVTANGGQNWTVKMRPDQITNSQQLSTGWPNLQFLSAPTGYLATGVALYRTDDSGTNWTPVEKDSVVALHFTNSNSGYSFAKPNKISRTSDGGANWTAIGTVPTTTSGGFAVLQFSNDQNGWFLDLFHLSITTNGGVGWKGVFQSKTDILEDLQLLTGQTAYMASTARLFKTTDGGITWQREYTHPPFAASGGTTSTGFIAIYFTDDHHGWACANDGTILRYSH